jgi:hypothetical protein
MYVTVAQTLSVQSGNLNFLEGCVHAYTPVDQPYPGTLLSTGTGTCATWDASW